jgi:hypothetical protein
VSPSGALFHGPELEVAVHPGGYNIGVRPLARDSVFRLRLGLPPGGSLAVAVSGNRKTHGRENDDTNQEARKRSTGSPQEDRPLCAGFRGGDPRDARRRIHPDNDWVRRTPDYHLTRAEGHLRLLLLPALDRQHLLLVSIFAWAIPAKAPRWFALFPLIGLALAAAMFRINDVMVNEAGTVLPWVPASIRGCG